MMRKLLYSAEAAIQAKVTGSHWKKSLRAIDKIISGLMIRWQENLPYGGE